LSSASPSLLRRLRRRREFGDASAEIPSDAAFAALAKDSKEATITTLANDVSKCG